MTIITPTGITGINSISSSGSTLVFQSASGTSPVVIGLDNISSAGVITATRFVGDITGNVNSSGVSTFTSGPVIIGSGTSTGTASQTLQVTGGAYVSGNLGIGITNPNYKMLIYGTNNSNEIRQSDGTVVSQWYQDFNGIGYFGTVSNHPQVFRTGGIDRVRVDASGRLGVGTEYSPSARVDVSLDGFVANTLSQVRSNSWGANGIINLYNAKGGTTGNEVLLLGSQAGGLGQLASGIGFGRENDGNWGTYLSFKTHSTSTSTIDELYERVRIDSAGRVTMPYQPACDAYGTGTCTVTDGTTQNLAISSFYTNRGFSISGNRLIIPKTGYYHFTTSYISQIIGSGYSIRAIRIFPRINGTVYSYYDARWNSAAATFSNTHYEIKHNWILNLAENDQLDLQVAIYHNKGSALNETYACNYVGCFLG